MSGAAAPAVPAPLRLASGTLFIAADGVLHVVTARGTFDLKARGISQLHERMAPFLQGTHTEADLLAAVPAALSGAVAGYLGRLRAVGALLDGGRTSPGNAVHRAMERLGTDRPRLRARAGAVRVRVRLDGTFTPRAKEAALSFASPRAAGRLLLRTGRRGGLPGRLTCVVSDADVTQGELERRAAYARWLLRNELDVLPEAPRLRLFRLDADGTLERLAETEDGAGDPLAVLPGQLAIVRVSETDQLPLVVAEAGHPLFAARAAACGTDLPRVRDHLLRIFISRLLLRAGPDGRCAFRSIPADSAGTERRTIRIPWPAEPAIEVEPSLASLRLALLERRADARLDAGALEWSEIDLLREVDDPPAPAYLRGVLGLRLPTLTARIATAPGGLVVCEANGRRARSFLRARAVGEVLLGAAWDCFHADRWRGAPPLLACAHADFAPPAAVRRLAAEQAAAAGDDSARIAVRRLRRWGIEAWAGVIPEVHR